MHEVTNQASIKDLFKMKEDCQGWNGGLQKDHEIDHLDHPWALNPRTRVLKEMEETDTGTWWGEGHEKYGGHTGGKEPLKPLEGV